MHFARYAFFVATASICTVGAGCHPNPTVTCTVAVNQLWPLTNKLVDVGLTASETFHGTPTITIEVWSDEPAGKSADAVIDTTAQSLELRARRDGASDGRVYLIIVRVGAAYDCCTVTVPHNDSTSAKSEVSAQAAAAEATCNSTGSAPAGYCHIAGP